MSKFQTAEVTHVHHWTDDLFTFRTTRSDTLRFENGHFIMIGLMINGKPLMRAYSIVSSNYDEYMEFFSIKVPDGPLTSHLQHLKVGDEILYSTKPTGTLVADNLLPGKNLYLLSTGTGLAPFMSIIKDPEIYERYEKIILVHGVRYAKELAYKDFIENELPKNEFFGDDVKKKLIYYPTVTREKYKTNGRLTELMRIGKLFLDIGLDEPNLDDDRFMICGSPSMLKETCGMLESKGFQESRGGHQAHFVIERAFVEK